ncbi:hypothetical protein B0J17DRAFT_709850 [Rhizoctonia solani]|nr:hypothetical protein B0J17DRAFT_709850 [Rhizoctonia solani]
MSTSAKLASSHRKAKGTHRHVRALSSLEVGCRFWGSKVLPSSFVSLVLVMRKKSWFTSLVACLKCGTTLEQHTVSPKILLLTSTRQHGLRPGRNHSDHGDEGSDVVSETSTVEYSHEPFETHQTRVRELLCSSLYLAHPTPFFPFPDVESYDTGADNTLRPPYILMHRLLDRSLCSILDELDTDEHCDMAKQVARLIAKIHSVTLPLGVGPLHGDTEGNLRVGRVPTSSPWSDDNKTTEDLNYAEDTEGCTLIPTTSSEFVTTRLAEFSTNALRAGPQEFKVKLYELAVRVVLFHHDFAPRNILVDRIGGGSWTITGVLDWDDCEAAPYEIAEEMDFEENEWDPDMPVTNEDSERIKQVFVKEIEELEAGFQDIVRITRDGCLRQLYERERGGIWSTQHIREVDRAVAVAQKLTKMADDGQS